MYNYSTIIFLLIWVSPYSSQENSSCGNWIPFKDEKCYRFFNHLSSFSDATDYCIQQDKESILVVIESKDEQDAIVKLLKASGVADNVWIGITKKDGVFKNADQTELVFKNWAENRPVPNKTGSDCVDLSTDDTNYGKWFDEKCQKQNAIICQKMQPWSITRLQTTLLDTRRELEVLKQNPVPIGFIYVQVLGQSEPKTLWPNTEWENISRKLAGLFFRVEGEHAAQFGQIQEQQTQSIQYFTERAAHDYFIYGSDKIQTIGTEFSYEYLFTGSSFGSDTFGIKFKHNTEENRPKNSALRLWQRIK